MTFVDNKMVGNQEKGAKAPEITRDPSIPDSFFEPSDLDILFGDNIKKDINKMAKLRCILAQYLYYEGDAGVSKVRALIKKKAVIDIPGEGENDIKLDENVRGGWSSALNKNPKYPNGVICMNFVGTFNTYNLGADIGTLSHEITHAYQDHLGLKRPILNEVAPLSYNAAKLVSEADSFATQAVTLYKMKDTFASAWEDFKFNISAVARMLEYSVKANPKSIDTDEAKAMAFYGYLQGQTGLFNAAEFAAAQNNRKPKKKIKFTNKAGETQTLDVAQNLFPYYVPFVDAISGSTRNSYENKFITRLLTLAEQQRKDSPGMLEDASAEIDAFLEKLPGNYVKTYFPDLKISDYAGLTIQHRQMAEAAWSYVHGDKPMPKNWVKQQEVPGSVYLPHITSNKGDFQNCIRYLLSKKHLIKDNDRSFKFAINLQKLATYYLEDNLKTASGLDPDLWGRVVLNHVKIDKTIDLKNLQHAMTDLGTDPDIIDLFDDIRLDIQYLCKGLDADRAKRNKSERSNSERQYPAIKKAATPSL